MFGAQRLGRALSHYIRSTNEFSIDKSLSIHIYIYDYVYIYIYIYGIFDCLTI